MLSRQSWIPVSASRWEALEDEKCEKNAPHICAEPESSHRNSMKNISNAPWLAVYPGLALVFTVFGFNLFGEGLRDILDPRLKSR